MIVSEYQRNTKTLVRNCESAVVKDRKRQSEN